MINHWISHPKFILAFSNLLLSKVDSEWNLIWEIQFMKEIFNSKLSTWRDIHEMRLAQMWIELHVQTTKRHRLFFYMATLGREKVSLERWRKAITFFRGIFALGSGCVEILNAVPWFHKNVCKISVTAPSSYLMFWCRFSNLTQDADGRVGLIISLEFSPFVSSRLLKKWGEKLLKFHRG